MIGEAAQRHPELAKEIVAVAMRLRATVRAGAPNIQ
jgi:hypothetical protein